MRIPIFYKGWGFLPAIILAALIGLSAWLTDAVLVGFSFMMALPLCFFVAGVLSFLLGLKLTREFHTLYFLGCKAWGIIFAVIGAAILIF